MDSEFNRQDDGVHNSDYTISNLFRYDLPGVNGLNFVLYNSLGGGGVASLRSDPQVFSISCVSVMYNELLSINFII